MKQQKNPKFKACKYIVAVKVGRKNELFGFKTKKHMMSFCKGVEKLGFDYLIGTKSA